MSKKLYPLLALFVSISLQGWLQPANPQVSPQVGYPALGDACCPTPPPPRQVALVGNECCPTPPPPRQVALVGNECCPTPPPPRQVALVDNECCPTPPPPRTAHS